MASVLDLGQFTGVQSEGVLLSHRETFLYRLTALRVLSVVGGGGGGGGGGDGGGGEVTSQQTSAISEVNKNF